MPGASVTAPAKGPSAILSPMETDSDLAPGASKATGAAQFVVETIQRFTRTLIAFPLASMLSACAYIFKG